MYCQKQLNDPLAQQTHLDRALEKKIELGRKYYEMAFMEKDSAKAIEYARKAVEILKDMASENIDACFMLADLYYHFIIDEKHPKRQFETGYELVKQAITRFLSLFRKKLKDMSFTILRYYEITDDLRLLDVARSFLTLYLSLNPLDGEAYEMLGDCYRSSREWLKAERCYKFALKVLKKDATKLNVLIKIAYVKEEIGELDEAEKYCNEALRIDPENYRALRKLAELKEKRDKIDDAIKIYEQLAKLYPENHHPTWNLARLHFLKATGYTASTRWHISPIVFNEGDLRKAAEYLMETHKRLPKTFQILEDLALCYFLLGDYDKAKEYKERAKKARSESKDETFRNE